jgi:lysozyme
MQKFLALFVLFIGWFFIGPASAQASVAQESAKLIAQFEGYSDRCYNDPVGHATIGYGHLLHYGPCTKKDMRLRWTKKEARLQLKEDIKYRIEIVQKATKKVYTTKNMKVALTSFVYNVGETAFKESTLLKLLKKGYYLRSANQLLRWKYGDNKRVLPGLVVRRKKERQVFLKGCPKVLVYCYSK